MSKKKTDVEGAPTRIEEMQKVLNNTTNSMLEWKEKCADLNREVIHWKNVVGGYKTSNENYRNKIDELKNQLEVERNRVSVLYCENEELQEKNRGLTDKITDLAVDRDKYKAMYDDYISLSWWQKIFL